MILEIILVLWFILSCGYLGWVAGYESGWYDRCCCKHHKLRKRKGVNKNG